MKYKLSKDFGKSLSRLNGKELKSVIDAIDEVECASSLADITDCKKLKSYSNVYRIRIGEILLSKSTDAPGCIPTTCCKSDTIDS